MAPNVNVVMYDGTASYQDDLGFVRHQLDELALVRVMGQFRPVDEIRYRNLCQKEQLLLARTQGDSVSD